MNPKPRSPFVKNRAEELGYDVWTHFVIPPFYDQLDLFHAKKPSVIQGGRGCGKTMLLRYLSHRSMFSPSRDTIPEEAFSRIGLYWKADTQFARILVGRGLDADIWRAAFEHGMTLRLASELVGSLRSIAESHANRLSKADLADFTLECLRHFDPSFPTALDELPVEFDRRWRRFLTWANNPRHIENPLFLPCSEFLRAIVAEIGRKLPTLQQPTYMVYIDEYENLLEYQQRLINTYLKSSEPPLIFNIAVKRNAIRNRRTLGDESITDIHDYRTIDVEQELSAVFPLFAAEILFLNLSVWTDAAGPVHVDVLRDPARLRSRREPQYQEQVLREARRLLPGMTHQQLAQEALSDPAVANRLRNELQHTLRRRGSNLSPEAFVRSKIPGATIVSLALLNRDSLTCEHVLQELERHERGESTQFNGTTDWVHNNFVGSLLRLYNLTWKTCPLYGGFEAFLNLAGANLRHFLELCHKSFGVAAIQEYTPDTCVPVFKQAEAALQASSDFLREIRSFGPYGNVMHRFVLTLGSLFALSQERPTQSEPERRHFAIVGGTKHLSTEDTEFFVDAAKWSVLCEEPETKRKDSLRQSGTQWVLNPIYSPYFRITHRKGRKLDLTTNEAITLIRGNYDERRRLLKAFQKKWSLTAEDVSTTLFSHLSGD